MERPLTVHVVHMLGIDNQDNMAGWCEVLTSTLVRQYHIQYIALWLWGACSVYCFVAPEHFLTPVECVHSQQVMHVQASLTAAGLWLSFGRAGVSGLWRSSHGVRTV